MCMSETKSKCRLEEVGKQAERRIDRAEARGADLQHDLHQAQHRAHQVLPPLCPHPEESPSCLPLMKLEVACKLYVCAVDLPILSPESHNPLISSCSFVCLSGPLGSLQATMDL